MGSGVFVGGTGVLVGGTGAGVLVGGTGVSVGTSVAGMGVLVGTGVSVKTGVSLGTAVSVSVGIGVADGGIGVLVNVGRGVRVARTAYRCATGVLVAQARDTANSKPTTAHNFNLWLVSVQFEKCFFRLNNFIEAIYVPRFINNSADSSMEMLVRQSKIYLALRKVGVKLILNMASRILQLSEETAILVTLSAKALLLERLGVIIGPDFS